MKILSTLTTIVLYSCGWLGLFLACRVGVWILELPALWSLPAALAIGLAVLLAIKILPGAASRNNKDRQNAKDNTSCVEGCGGGCAAPAAMHNQPGMSIRFRRAWERGHSYRKGRLLSLSPQPPWFLCLSMPGSLPGHLLELGDAAVEDTMDHADAFTWRRGPKAAWLDFPDNNPGDEEWRSFAGMLGGIPQFTPPAGVVIRIDGARILNNTHASIHDDTPIVRRRLLLLQKACRKRLPCYLVVDNIDRLYGLRSIMSKAGAETRTSPLGRIRRGSRDDYAVFVSTCIDHCLAELRYPGSDAGPAALQAADEIRRLETPLVALLAQLTQGNAQGPFIRGLFLAAAAPGGEMTPALLSRLPTFQPLDETLPVQPWFLRRLLRDDIPDDAEAARNAVGEPIRFAYPASATGLLAGSVALCLLMTCSFFESRGVLLSARGRASAPSSPEKLQQYLELTDLTHLRNKGWRLPRFGMNEPQALEGVLRQRFTESYFDLKTIPSVEHVQDAAIEAAESSDPVAIGNALLQLAVTRAGIGRNLKHSGDNEKSSRFLQALVKILRLASDDDLRQLETYFAWAGQQAWMPETHAALMDFEKYIIHNATGGDLSWLPAWVGHLPGLRAIDTSRVWDIPARTVRPESRIEPEWTLEGYRIACGLLSAVRYGGTGAGDGADSEATAEWLNKRERALEMYRMGAMERWRSAASVLWNDFQSRTPDSRIRELFHDAAVGDDPAGRFLQLVDRELLPMFENVDNAAHPDLHWLRLQAGLLRSMADRPSGAGTELGELAGRLAEAVRDLGSDNGMERLTKRIVVEPVNADAANARRDWQNALRQAGTTVENPEGNLEAIRSQFLSWANPGQVNFSGQFVSLRDAADPAVRLHRFLFSATGSKAWDGLSPLAILDYMRYLATRRAALKLDAMWREQVYQPVQLTAGGEAERLSRLTAPEGPLAKFLTGAASGFWRWNGQRLVNAEWNRLEFMFDQGFLDFCSATLRDGAAAKVDATGLPFSFDAVHVDAGARECPVAVRLVFESGSGKRDIVFRNYRLRETLDWNFDETAAVEMEVMFPSVTASARMTGEELMGFFLQLGEGSVRFGRERFPDVAAALGRMGVSGVTLKAKVDKSEALLKKAGAQTRSIPESVICESVAAEQETATAIVSYGPFSSHAPVESENRITK